MYITTKKTYYLNRKKIKKQMAVCNLFKKLTKNTGNIFVFSQWAEDLTKNNAHGHGYRVVPSRFVAMNIDYSNFEPSGISQNDGSDLNITLPQYLQNKFENSVAYCKSHLENYTPETSSNLFWNALGEAKLLNIVHDDDGDWVKEIMCIGDINIQNFEEVDGMGYSEIYCYIPNSAARSRVRCQELVDYKYVTNQNKLIEGYDEKDVPNMPLDGRILPGCTYEFDRRYVLDLEGDSIRLDVNSYAINGIIILYDILSVQSDGNSVVLYKNIPMGMYVPGMFVDGEMTNIITKWVSNDSIYDSGTSYGIRICSRFSVVPNSDSIQTTVSELNGGEMAELSKLLGAMADNLLEMKNVVKDQVFTSKSLKTTLNIFQNSKTNVPYLLDVNGKKYWFVNGKNTGVTVPNGNIEHEPYSDDVVMNNLTTLIGVDTALALTAYPIENGEKKYYERLNEGEQEPVNLLIKWELINKYNGQLVDVDKIDIYPTTDVQGLDPNFNTFRINGVKNDTLYTLKTTWVVEDENNVDEEYTNQTDIDFKFYYPMFFGTVTSQDITTMPTDQVSIDYLEDKLTKYILPSQYNRVNMVSNGDHIVYMYPKAWGKLDKIINRNSMDESIHDFMEDDTVREVKVVLKDGITVVSYYVYYTTDPTGEDVGVTFDFTNDKKEIDNTITCQK